MKFWPFGAAVVFLVALLISACNSYLLGNMSRVEGKWMSPRPGRQREPPGTKQERLNLSRVKREKHCVSENGCCTECPAGKFLKNCTCETCSDGSYTEYSNSETECRSCQPCNPDAHQVAVKECAPEHNRVCGCESGFYKVKDHDEDDTDFFCHQCTECVTSNKQTKKNCSEELDAECGACLPNFHLQGKECQEREKPLNLQRKNEFLHRNNTKRGEDPRDFRNTAYLLFCLPCLLLLGAGITYCKRRRISGESSPVDTLLAAAGTASAPKHKSEEPAGNPLSTSPAQVQCGLLPADPSPQRSLLQGRKLYTVIDAVPARRWKEFMRGLGLRDGEIEAVEVEYTQLREQQYEMLKRWRQQQGATMDAIFAVLEDMQLGGCAQELREQLQPSSLLPTL